MSRETLAAIRDSDLQRSPREIGHEFAMLIDGDWTPSASGECFSCVDPYLEESWGRIPLADGTDVDRAVRAAMAQRGGATRYTTSWFRITEDRRLDPNFIDQMEQVSNGLADLDYCRTLADNTAEALGFLENNGVEVIYFKQPFPNRNTGGGLGMPAGGGAAIVEGLAGVVERTQGSGILYETEAVRLSLSTEGRVDGAIVRGRDGLLRRLRAVAFGRIAGADAAAARTSTN